MLAAKIGRPNRLMRFLRVLGLGAVKARLLGHVIGGEAHPDGLARGVERTHVHLHAVGPHIGDRARLVERLRQPHGVAGRIAELARGLLLQCRGGERRRRVAPQWLGLDLLDREGRAFDRGFRGHRAVLVAQCQPVDFAAVEADQPRGELGPVMRQRGDHAPVFLRLERFDLALPVDNDAQRHRLHPPRALGAGQPPPQHRRKREAIEIVERAAGEIGVDQRLVEFAWAAHRLGHRLLGDGVEGDALDIGGQRLLLRQQLAHVPRNRLPLAIGVGGEHQPRRLPGRVGDLLEAALLVAVELPVHREALVGPHAPIFGRQIADMAVGGENLEVLAEIFLDGAGLGR